MTTPRLIRLGIADPNNRVARLMVGLIAVTLSIQFTSAAGVLSSPLRPTVSASGSSVNPTFSADGQHIVFVSHANNLATNDDANLSLDVFVRDLVSSNTVLVSVNTSGVGGANADANYPSISSNGQFVAFASRASNLVGGDVNGAIDVFVRDMNAGLTRFVSVDLNGNSPTDPSPTSIIPLSGNPVISADGRWVFFESRATNLIASGAPLGSVNIYARDTWSNSTVLVTSDTNGLALAGRQTLSSLSADGRFVAFISSNLNVFPGVTNAAGDAYVRDLQTGAMIWATRNAAAVLGGSYLCRGATVNADGHYVVVDVSLVSSGASSTVTVIRQDNLNAGAYLTIGSSSEWPSQVSADGRFVLYQPGGLRVYDCVGQTNQQVGWMSYQACGAVGFADGSAAGSLSSNGRFVAFRLLEGYVCSGVNTPVYVYRRNLETGESNVVALTTNGAPWNSSGSFITLTISPDGSLVAFDSIADVFAAEDHNGASDIFLRDVNAGATELITKAQPAKPAATSFAHSFLGLNSISADARFIVSTRYDDPSARGDTNGWRDLFVADLRSNRVVALSVSSNAVFLTNAYESPVISADGSVIASLRTDFPAPSGAFGNPDRHIAVARRITEVTTYYIGGGSNVYVTNEFFAPPMTEVAEGSSIALSADGLMLAFDTVVDYCGLGNFCDQNFRRDVLLRRWGRRPDGTLMATNYLVSSPSNETSGNEFSAAPVLIPGGELAFVSRAGNLGAASSAPANAPYSHSQIVVADLNTNDGFSSVFNFPKRLVSYSSFAESTFVWTDPFNTNSTITNVNWYPIPVSANASNVVVSADGRYLFYSIGDGTVTYRHDLRTFHTNIYEPGGPPYGVVRTNLVAGALNTLACTNCRNLSVSADGNLIAFERPRSGSSFIDVFAADLRNNEETLVNVSLSGVVTEDRSPSPVIGADGRYIAFQSRAGNLIAADNNAVTDVFVRDRLLGVTMLVSANAQGLPGNGPSTRPVMAADGRTVVFQSFASDLVDGDYNEKRDIFVLKLGGADTDGDGMDDDWEVTHFENLSRDGTGDFDNDGASDYDEFVAGTSPKANDSFFRLLTISTAGGASALVLWSGNPNRNYRVEFKDDLNAAAWTPLTSAISWNGATAFATDTNMNVSAHRYYRVARVP